MNAKEMQLDVIKRVMKPAFKEHGFKNKGTNFYRAESVFYKILSIENSQWNSRDDVTFWLNFSLYFPAIDGEMPEQKLCAYKFTPNCRIDEHIATSDRTKTPFRDKTGYQITSDSDHDAAVEYFSNQMKPVLDEIEKIRKLEDFAALFPHIEVWDSAFDRKRARLKKAYPSVYLRGT
jgi:hypothetical protein